MTIAIGVGVPLTRVDEKPLVHLVEPVERLGVNHVSHERVALHGAQAVVDRLHDTQPRVNSEPCLQRVVHILGELETLA